MNIETFFIISVSKILILKEKLINALLILYKSWECKNGWQPCYNAAFTIKIYEVAILYKLIKDYLTMS